MDKILKDKQILKVVTQALTVPKFSFPNKTCFCFTLKGIFIGSEKQEDQKFSKQRPVGWVDSKIYYKTVTEDPMGNFTTDRFNIKQSSQASWADPSYPLLEAESSKKSRDLKILRDKAWLPACTVVIKKQLNKKHLGFFILDVSSDNILRILYYSFIQTICITMFRVFIKYINLDMVHD